MAKYVAYVGSYSYTGEAKGITVYDVNVERGIFEKRCEVEVDNSSYVIASKDRRTLYSIADEGVVAFSIGKDGNLTRRNSSKIRGMRGCHLSTDVGDRHIFVSGYHDGKTTVLRLKEDGSILRIADGVFQKGLGSVAERNFRPHVTCTRRTPDDKYVFSADSGMDRVQIYRFDDVEERLTLVDAIRCDVGSSPRHFRFSPDGKFIYLMYEQKNVIDVFTYNSGDRSPDIERIQTISTRLPNQNRVSAATCIRFSADYEHLFCGNAGDDTVTLFKRDKETGLLEMKFSLPVSGAYPKDIAVFPDKRHIASLNHESGTITFFTVDYEKNLLLMCAREIKCNQPNCCVMVKVEE